MITYDEFLDFLRDQGYDDIKIGVMLFEIEDNYADYLSALEDYGYEEADRDTYDQALNDLFEAFEVEDYSTDMYTCNGNTYYAFDDFDQAKEVAVDQVRDLIMTEGFTFINGWEDYVDEEWFEDAMMEMNEGYAADFATEGSSTYDNRLVEEFYDRGLIDDSDFREDEDGEIDYTDCVYDDYKLEEMLAEDLYDDDMRHYGSASAWYIDQFGQESFDTVVENNNLIDVDELAEYVVRSDGPENTLASYDGNENEQDVDGITIWLYRYD